MIFDNCYKLMQFTIYKLCYIDDVKHYDNIDNNTNDECCHIDAPDIEDIETALLQENISRG